MLSVFDIFKIGIGPSSSHTVGPMVAALRFVEAIGDSGQEANVARIEVSLFGSLALTGKGHGTDNAVILGLSGCHPQSVEAEHVRVILDDAAKSGGLNLGGRRTITFNLKTDIVFNAHEIGGHPNGIMFTAFSGAELIILRETFFSIGGGFVVTANELRLGGSRERPEPTYVFSNAAELLDICSRTGLSIAEIVLTNEFDWNDPASVRIDLARIRAAMMDSIDRGIAGEGELPGGLRVKRRAGAIWKQLAGTRQLNNRSPHECMDWVSLFAIAVNEENAAGGRVVTAPTNGAAGVVPSVLRYYEEFCSTGSNIEATTQIFLLTAAAVGQIIKRNASISGAEVGCQGEVGAAAAMAAAGFTALLDGSPDQIENAAEIALEHHLGMTCDPIGGLVQIPCIERNAMGAVKAINAASLALKGDGRHRVSLDQTIAAMLSTGRDMDRRYKETALGGLAVNVPEC